MQTGGAALTRVVERYGLETFRECVARMYDHGEAVVRDQTEAIADAVRAHEPEAVRLAAPELGAVTLATAAALADGSAPSGGAGSPAGSWGTADILPPVDTLVA